MAFRWNLCMCLGMELSIVMLSVIAISLGATFIAVGYVQEIKVFYYTVGIGLIVLHIFLLVAVMVKRQILIVIYLYATMTFLLIHVGVSIVSLYLISQTFSTTVVVANAFFLFMVGMVLLFFIIVVTSFSSTVEEVVHVKVDSIFPVCPDCKKRVDFQYGFATKNHPLGP